MSAPEFTWRGWLLAEGDRARLLALIPPVYPEVIAHHVTFAPEHLPTPEVESAEAVGVADDGRGVQAVVVSLNGGTDRPDGSTWHITWSLGPGRRAVESNTAIREHGWKALAEPVPITLKRAG